MPSGLMDAGHDAERGELGLALARQDSDRRAADARRLGDEGAAVARVAAGGGGDRPHLAHVQMSHSARNRRSASSALSMASAANSPVDCTWRPRPASTFSLKIGVGLRVSPS